MSDCGFSSEARQRHTVPWMEAQRCTSRDPASYLSFLSALLWKRTSCSYEISVNPDSVFKMLKTVMLTSGICKVCVFCVNTSSILFVHLWSHVYSKSAVSQWDVRGQLHSGPDVQTGHTVLRFRLSFDWLTWFGWTVTVWVEGWTSGIVLDETSVIVPPESQGVRTDLLMVSDHGPGWWSWG